jgi:hypothetical protein
MSINIPDSLPKLIILVGIICIAAGLYMKEELTENYYSKFDKFDEIQDAFELENFVVELELENLIKRSHQLSEMFELENPIKSQDSIITFEQTFSGNKKKVLLTDSLNIYWSNYVKNKASLDILKKRMDIKSENIEIEKKILDSRKYLYGFYLEFGIVFFILGVNIWLLDIYFESKKIIKQTDKVFNFCQSCGHNFTSIRTNGTEKDKSNNFAFCIECYKKGKLKEPELTNEDFINRKKIKIKNLNWLSRKVLMKRLLDSSHKCNFWVK